MLFTCAWGASVSACHSGDEVPTKFGVSAEIIEFSVQREGERTLVGDVAVRYAAVAEEDYTLSNPLLSFNYRDEEDRFGEEGTGLVFPDDFPNPVPTGLTFDVVYPLRFDWDRVFCETVEARVTHIAESSSGKQGLNNNRPREVDIPCP